MMEATIITREEISRLVPHSGDMLLIDAVTSWDTNRITCNAHVPRLSNPSHSSHASHPLASAGRLPAIAAAEYAAQAAAVHGSLVDGVRARPGLLAKLNDVKLHVRWFPPSSEQVAVQIRVCATVLSRSEAGCAYAFHVFSVDTPVAHGRLIVAFSTAAET